MFQFYFLSIVLNLMGGLLLLLFSFEPKKKLLVTFRSFFTHKVVQTVFGIAILVTGVLKLFIHTANGGIIIIEDLLPAIAGIVAGGLISLDVFAKEGSTNKKLDELESKIKPGFIVIGIAVIVIAILHFLYPTAILL